jgi:hypothetical protein
VLRAEVLETPAVAPALGTALGLVCPDGRSQAAHLSVEIGKVVAVMRLRDRVLFTLLCILRTQPIIRCEVIVRIIMLMVRWPSSNDLAPKGCCVRII